MTAVPAVAGRVLRFDGALPHAVPRPSTLWLDDEDAVVDPIEEWVQSTHPQLFERSVVLFNTWREPPRGVDRESDEESESDLEAAEVCCAPRQSWQTVPLATPPAGSPTAVIKLRLLGDEARRGQHENSLTLPVDADLVRSALASNWTATRIEPPRAAPALA